jgi:hypothetical protein
MRKIFQDFVLSCPEKTQSGPAFMPSSGTIFSNAIALGYSLLFRGIS